MVREAAICLGFNAIKGDFVYNADTALWWMYKAAQQTTSILPCHRWLVELSEQFEAASDIVDCVFFTHYCQHSARAGLHLQGTLITNIIEKIFKIQLCLHASGLTWVTPASWTRYVGRLRLMARACSSSK